MIQRHVGLDPGLFERVEHFLVEPEPVLVDRTPPLGQQARPGEREPERLGAQRPHHLDVPGVEVVEVAGDVPVLVVVDLMFFFLKFEI